MLKSSLCDSRDAYILVSGTITVAALATGGGNNGKNVIFKNCAPFIDCISRINNTQVDNAKDIETVMPMYNLTEYSNNYLNTFGSLCQYYRDELSLHNPGNVVDFAGANHNSKSSKYKRLNNRCNKC